MAPSRITVVIKHEDLFEQAFNIDVNAKLTALRKRWQDHLSPDYFGDYMGALELMYGGEKLDEVRAAYSTASELGMREGDTISVVVVEYLEPLQDHLMYLSQPSVLEVHGYEPPKSIVFKMENRRGLELAFTVQDNTPVKDAMEAYARLAGTKAIEMGFRFKSYQCASKGAVVTHLGTLREAGVKDGCTIYVHQNA